LEKGKWEAEWRTMGNGEQWEMENGVIKEEESRGRERGRGTGRDESVRDFHR